MTPYPKTENLYARDETTQRLTGELRRADFGQVDRWLVTEKIDGTNIRLVYRRDEEGMTVRGRTDAASLPPLFTDEALPTDLAVRCEAALDAIDSDRKATIMVVYGEGYGPGIQKGGGSYAPRKSLRVFDVVTYKVSYVHPSGAPGGTTPLVPVYSRALWRTWDDVVTVANSLGLGVPPCLGVMTMPEILDLVRSDPLSIVAYEEGPTETRPIMEGVVARTDPYLYDYRGSRVLWKLKVKDLPE